MRLNQITIPVSDIPTSREFYTRLGFQLLVESAHYSRFLAPEGDTTLSLHIVDEAIVPGAVIYLENDDMDAQVKDLKEKGFTFQTEPEDMGWLWREAILLDPDGHKIKIFHAGENRIDPPWRVKPEDA
jgi:catechol 2,3-dioxygenase-like lactoylglutathione lyase family enzyme